MMRYAGVNLKNRESAVQTGQTALALPPITLSVAKNRLCAPVFHRGALGAPVSLEFRRAPERIAQEIAVP